MTKTISNLNIDKASSLIVTADSNDLFLRRGCSGNTRAYHVQIRGNVRQDNGDLIIQRYYCRAYSHNTPQCICAQQGYCCQQYTCGVVSLGNLGTRVKQWKPAKPKEITRKVVERSPAQEAPLPPVVAVLKVQRGSRLALHFLQWTTPARRTLRVEAGVAGK